MFFFFFFFVLNVVVGWEENVSCSRNTLPTTGSINHGSFYETVNNNRELEVTEIMRKPEAPMALTPRTFCVFDECKQWTMNVLESYCIINLWKSIFSHSFRSCTYRCSRENLCTVYKKIIFFFIFFKRRMVKEFVEKLIYFILKN